MKSYIVVALASFILGVSLTGAVAVRAADTGYSAPRLFINGHEAKPNERNEMHISFYQGMGNTIPQVFDNNGEITVLITDFTKKGDK